MDSPQQKLRKEFDNYLLEIVKEAKNSFTIERPQKKFINLTYLNHFILFKILKKPKIDQVWLINSKTSPFYILSIEADTTLLIEGRISTLRETQTHRFLFALIISDNILGESLIIKETFSHKISELFHKIEIDFKENKKFSSQYYCLSKNESHFRSVMNDEMMKYLSTVQNTDFEFNGKACLVRPEKSIIDKPSASRIFEIGGILAKLL